MRINRQLDISKEIKPGKALLIMGPRRVGKTTILGDFLDSQANQNQPQKFRRYNGTSFEVREMFSYPSMTKLANIVDGYDILAIDEAQMIPNIGQTLKLLTDERPDLAIVVTGSSSFELLGQIGEPLVGRKRTRFLYPISLKEYVEYKQSSFLEAEIKNLLVYGMYPDSIMADNNDERQEWLDELVNSLLLKDVLEYQEVKGADIIFKLLRLLAFQIGTEVSMEEMGKKLGISKTTVLRYVDLLEKAYIIFKLPGFTRELASEVNKMSRYYFYDTGVRNAVINNFAPLGAREDADKLWENFCLVERMKSREYNKINVNQYFWRTWGKQEISLLEEKNGHLEAFNFSLDGQADQEIPALFTKNYPDAKVSVITLTQIALFASVN
jgi:predicted AAA+ superfamily ATPase